MKSKVYFSPVITPEKVLELYKLAGKELTGNIAIKNVLEICKPCIKLCFLTGHPCGELVLLLSCPVAEICNVSIYSILPISFPSLPGIVLHLFPTIKIIKPSGSILFLNALEIAPIRCSLL